MKLALALLSLLLAVPALAQPSVSSTAVEGTEVVVNLADGRSLRSRDLVGAVLDVRFADAPAKVRIVAAERDPNDRSGTIWLHTVETRRSDGSWANLCNAGSDGRRQGFPLHSAGKGLEFICTAGAVGKCVRFGYRPWATGLDGQSLRSQHEACVRMVRADYGGSDEPWTRDGMTIDVFDPQGIQTADDAPDLSFEAGWSPEGAVCVHHVRVTANITLAALEEKYPRLRGRTGAICTPDFARAQGAIIFNRSRP
jgi:hypothetical protein